jgi:hypothetical protein
MSLREVGCGGGRGMDVDKFHWRSFVEVVVNLRFIWKEA